MIAKDAHQSGQIPLTSKGRAPVARPLEGERLAHLVRDTRRALVKALQVALAKHSVAYGHWTFLRILWNRDDINQRRLSDLAGVMQPTTFAALQAMERLGYIERRRRPDNRKNIYVYLTAEGRALREKLEPPVIAINDRCLAGVPDADIATTRRTLLAMIHNLSRECAEPAPSPRRGVVTRLPKKPAPLALVTIAESNGMAKVR